MASLSSAKCGSKALSGKEDPLGPWTDSRADSRREEREDGRRGVVGRGWDGVRGREVERPRGRGVVDMLEEVRWVVIACSCCSGT